MCIRGTAGTECPTPPPRLDAAFFSFQGIPWKRRKSAPLYAYPSKLRNGPRKNLIHISLACPHHFNNKCQTRWTILGYLRGCFSQSRSDCIVGSILALILYDELHHAKNDTQSIFPSPSHSLLQLLLLDQFGDVGSHLF